MKCNKQLKYSNYVAFSHFHGTAVNNSGLVFASSVMGATVMVAGFSGSFAPVVTAVAQAGLEGISTPGALAFIAILSMLPDKLLADCNLGWIASYNFGLLEYEGIRAFVFLWFVVHTIVYSIGITHIGGMSLKELLKRFGQIASYLVAISQITANYSGTITQAATAVSSNLTGNMIHNSLNAAVCFLILLIVPVIYYFIRCLSFFIDILLIPVCSSVPFSSGGIELLKMIFIAMLGMTALYRPYIFCVIFAFILLIAIVVFRKAYITIRYFKNIYAKPFIRKFKGYDDEIPLVASKIPKKVLAAINDDMTDIIIPVYLIEKLPDHKYMRKHDRWWFISMKDTQFICKPRFFKKECYRIDLNNSVEKKMFIKKSVRFFEVFNLKGNEESIGRAFSKVHKKVHFVFSKEYYYRFEEIKELTMFTDYTEYRNQIKQDIKLSRKEKREERRQAKLEAKEEKRMARQRKKNFA